MANLKTRVKAIETPVRERWQRAWNEFFRLAWEPLSDSDLEAYVSAANERMGMTDFTEVNRIIDQWSADYGDGPDAPSSPWIGATYDILEAYAAGDLAVWPDAIGDPPDEESEAWGILTTALHSDNINEQVAAVSVLNNYLTARAARKYNARHKKAA